MRLIQEREIEKVGSPHPIPVDVRIIAATHRNLESLVNAGAFRKTCTTGSPLSRYTCRRFDNGSRISPSW